MNGLRQGLRWAGRIIGTLGLAIVVVTLASKSLIVHEIPVGLYPIVLWMALAALVISWRHDMLGGLLLVWLSINAAAIVNDALGLTLLAVYIMSLPLVVAGVLLFGAGLLSRDDLLHRAARA